MSLEAAAEAAGYTLVNLAARGSHSSIYRADHIASGERVALKVFDTDTSSADVRERVDRLSSINHANLLPIRDVLDLGGEPTVVLPWSEGRPLAEVLAGPDPMPEVRAEAIFSDVLDGLAALHQHNVGHAALDDRAVLVDGDSGVLIDFGVGTTADAATDTIAADLRATGRLAEQLFARTDLPEWRSAAIRQAAAGAHGSVDDVRAGVLPSRRKRTQLERAERGEDTTPRLLLVAVGAGVTLLTLAAFLVFGPDEEPFPQPTITGVEEGTDADS